MKIFLLSILAIIIYLIDICSSQSCSSLTTSTQCDTASACKWLGGTDGQCNCASEVKLDILFGLDTSGSIGWEGFQIQKDFVLGLVDAGVANDSRLGFYMFNTYVNQTQDIQSWADRKTELLTFVRGMWWSGGWTNTGQLVSDGLAHFADPNIYDASRQQIFIIITDGNPCLPQSQGGCPQSACQYKTQVFQAGVRVVVIGVGDGLNQKYVKCLTQQDSDWIPVSGYDKDAFDTIKKDLSEVLCPVSKEFKITEVKALKKSDGTYVSDAGSETPMPSRLTRFVEIYNAGIDFNVSDISITGLIELSIDNAITATVYQSQYAVFYDASENPISTTGSTPTCHLCEWDATNENKPCDLSSCGIYGSSGSAGTCFCANSVYIACSNQDTGALSRCQNNLALTANSLGNVYDGCGECVFQDGYTNKGWDVGFYDAKLIDEVIHSKPNTGSWIEQLDGFSLELAYKSYDNDYGTLWIQSCSRFGTPGSDPYAQCPETCVTLGSDCGGTNTCDVNSGNCLCDATTGYYPSCQSPGIGCFQCAEVPEVEECVVVWRNNGTEKYAYYNWTVNSPSANGGFFLQFFANSEAGNCPDGVIGGGQDSDCNVAIKNVGDVNAGEFTTTDAIFDQFKRIDDYYTLNDTIGGYVYAFEAVCEGYDSINAAKEDGASCDFYRSEGIECVVITSAPTASPTNSPTVPPTPEPTNNPTASPTFACPRYWIYDDDVCSQSGQNGYAGDRCTCTGKDYYSDTKSCCLLEPDWSVTYDRDRKHKTTDECRLDVELNKPKCRYLDCDEGDSVGYLLSEGDHSFPVKISPEAQPCRFDICWTLNFTSTNCNYGDRRRRMASSTISDGEIVCDEDSTSLAAAGLAIDVTSGCLKVWTQSDVKNATIDFTVTRLDCDEAEAALNGNTNSTRRRLANTKCFDSIALYGELALTTTSSECQPDCVDGRIYPMRVPVWYNYKEAFVAPPAEEKELPAWLWWLIAALVVFLALLALLVYKYWWKNKATGAALGATQADLDAAVMENEQGFGGDLGNGQVGFNPLATGFNPNAPAGVGNPNGPPPGNGGGNQFVRTNVEKPVFRVDFGQQMGNMR